MIRFSRTLPFGAVSCLLLAISSAPYKVHAEDAGPKAAPLDEAMGVWQGTWSDSNVDSGTLSAKIFATGKETYEGTLVVVRKGQKPYSVPLKGQRSGERVTMEGTVDLGGERTWAGTAKDGELVGTFAGTGVRKGTFQLRRVETKPPSLGSAPPGGAIVLFDGKNLDEWSYLDGSPAGWKIVDGAMEVVPRMVDGKKANGNLVTRRKFGDMQLHLEFQTPFMPEARGQQRGNSGIYFQSRYEVQVLDSFGQPPRINEAGAIYEVSVPRENASLPPGAWQTYDIHFMAPRFENGQVTQPAQLTVVYNGIQVQFKVPVPKPTRAAAANDVVDVGPLMLQDHGNPVRYRNIWVIPIDPSQESSEEKPNS